MSKKIKLILIAIASLCVLLFAVYKFMLQSAERNIESEKALFTVSSKSISEEFSANIESSTTKYQDKTIEMSGIVTTVSGKQLILDGIAICEMVENQNQELQNKKITLKGRFVGFDDLMGELKLDQCTLLK